MYNPTGQKKIVEAAAAIGVPAIAAEHTMVIRGLEQYQYLLQTFAIPNNISEENILYYLPGGIEQATQQIPKVHQQHAISFRETTAGSIIDLLEYLTEERNVNSRREFTFDLYRGTPEFYTRKWIGHNAFLFGIEASEFDYEDRTTLVKPTGQISYNFYKSDKA